MNSARPEAYGTALSAMILGILAAVFNLLAILAPIGFILGLIAITLGAMTLKKHSYGKAGFILGLLSFIPIATYVFTYIAIKMVDPFM